MGIDGDVAVVQRARYANDYPRNLKGGSEEGQMRNLESPYKGEVASEVVQAQTAVVQSRFGRLGTAIFRPTRTEGRRRRRWR